MADNDPKHTSNAVNDFLKSKSITMNWWQTLAESPDCNPIENLWHELKEYIRCATKPTTKQLDEIKEFWDTIYK